MRDSFAGGVKLKINKKVLYSRFAAMKNSHPSYFVYENQQNYIGERLIWAGCVEPFDSAQEDASTQRERGSRKNKVLNILNESLFRFHSSQFHPWVACLSHISHGFHSVTWICLTCKIPRAGFLPGWCHHLDMKCHNFIFNFVKLCRPSVWIDFVNSKP